MLCLVKMKACKRCGGDLSLESDRYGTYFGCIQCGASWNESDLMPPSTRVASERRVSVAAKTGDL